MNAEYQLLNYNADLIDTDEDWWVRTDIVKLIVFRLNTADAIRLSQVCISLYTIISQLPGITLLTKYGQLYFQFTNLLIEYPGAFNLSNVPLYPEVNEHVIQSLANIRRQEQRLYYQITNRVYLLKNEINDEQRISTLDETELYTTIYNKFQLDNYIDNVVNVIQYNRSFVTDQVLEADLEYLNSNHNVIDKTPWYRKILRNRWVIYGGTLLFLLITTAIFCNTYDTKFKFSSYNDLQETPHHCQNIRYLYTNWFNISGGSGTFAYIDALGNPVQFSEPGDLSRFVQVLGRSYTINLTYWRNILFNHYKDNLSLRSYCNEYQEHIVCSIVDIAMEKGSGKYIDMRWIDVSYPCLSESRRQDLILIGVIGSLISFSPVYMALISFCCK